MFSHIIKTGRAVFQILPHFHPVAIALAFILSGSFAFGQLTLSFAPEYYYWQENANGAKVLDESGARVGLELSYKQPVDHGWLWAGRLKIYGGPVNYNGQTQTGIPLKSTTDYVGGLGEGLGGYRWDFNPGEYLDLLGGLGLEDWSRTLTGSGGYTENWLPIYLKAGLELCPKADIGWLGALGVKLPIYTTQTVDLSGFGGPTFTLHPETRPSPYAEAGYQYKALSLVAYFDSYWFGQSPTVQSEGFSAFQPESLSFEAGLKIGWTF